MACEKEPCELIFYSEGETISGTNVPNSPTQPRDRVHANTVVHIVIRLQLGTTCSHRRTDALADQLQPGAHQPHHSQQVRRYSSASSQFTSCCDHWSLLLWSDEHEDLQITPLRIGSSQQSWLHGGIAIHPIAVVCVALAERLSGTHEAAFSGPCAMLASPCDASKQNEETHAS
jgi:hypothetical protein